MEWSPSLPCLRYNPDKDPNLFSSQSRIKADLCFEEQEACVHDSWLIANGAMSDNQAMSDDDGQKMQVRRRIFDLQLPLFVCVSMVSLAGCADPGSIGLQTPTGAVVGRAGYWNYSPSVIQEGDIQKIWWCGAGTNPTDTSQTSDTILYETVNTVTNAKTGPVIVLAETKGSWDSAYTCNARVIRGAFVNPLGDGVTYTYEMFYVGSVSGINNSIGAAFSNDGIKWTKYPEPVILSTSSTNYGVGQPVVYNADGKSAIKFFYEDYTPAVHHVEAISTDGVHFAVQGSLTTNGLDPTNPDPVWSDMGYDPSTKFWYAAFDLPPRAPDTTGGFVEPGPYGFQLYRIPDSSLLTGAVPWQLLKTVDTNLTGYEANFLPSLLHGEHGDINVGTYPKLQLFVSSSIPRPAWDASPEAAGKSSDVYQWAIAVNSYDPDQKDLTLMRYRNGKTYEVTSGWADPVKFFPDKALAHLYPAPQNRAEQPFYGCKQDELGYFVSLDVACEGQRILGVNGYGWALQPSGIQTVALYTCKSTQYGRFLSKDPACEGSGKGKLLGYALP
jgi:hypothetical protein